MITIDRKNKTAVDIAFHIPLPSFQIRISKDDSEKIQNTALGYNASKEAAVEQAALQQEKAAEQAALHQEAVRKDAGAHGPERTK